MGTYDQRLPFDRPIQDLEAELRAAEAKPETPKDVLRELRRKLLAIKRQIYSNLKPWEVGASSSPPRPPTDRRLTSTCSLTILSSCMVTDSLATTALC